LIATLTTMRDRREPPMTQQREIVSPENYCPI
jgi:hypothetical protein